MPLLIGLLVVTFAIAGDLAHEAWTTARAQRETADRARHDFVRYAATSLAVRAEGVIGGAVAALVADVDGGVGDGAGRARFPGPEAMVAAAGRVRECRCAPELPARWYFRVPIGTGGAALRTGGDSLPTDDAAAAIAAAVRRDAARLSRERAEMAAREHILIVEEPAPTRVIAYIVRGGARDAAWAYGLVMDADAFAYAVFESIGREELRSPLRGSSVLPADSLVVASLRTPSGRLLYDPLARRAPRLTMVPTAGHESYMAGPMASADLGGATDTVHLPPRLAHLVLDVALTANASRFLAPDVPRSHLSVVLGLLVLMGGLVAVAVMQLRREHELARQRAEFTAAVSHELRTPLAQILLYGETLLLERTRSERERRGAAEVIVREAQRLMHLVENALHYARSDRRAPRRAPERVAIVALTREIVAAFAPLAAGTRLLVAPVPAGEVEVMLDPAAYRQMLLNLLDNAVKYGSREQTVRVAVHVLGANEAVHIHVDDEGRGVSEQERERIWEPFVRSAGPAGATVGAGIGLSIVRELAQRHGGAAWVERGPRRGARFVIALPVESGAPIPHDAPAVSAPSRGTARAR